MAISPKLAEQLARLIKTPDGRTKKPEELHPTVMNLLLFSYPASPETDPVQAARFGQLYGALANFHYVIPPEKFQEICVAYATGLQFSLDRHGGNHKVDLLDFQMAKALREDRLVACDTQHYTNTITGKEGEHSRVYLSEDQLLKWAGLEAHGAMFGTGHTETADLNLREAVLAFGVEEMDHAIRHQQFRREHNRLLTQEELQQIEDAAKPVVREAVEAYALGASKRGRQLP